MEQARRTHRGNHRVPMPLLTTSSARVHWCRRLGGADPVAPEDDVPCHRDEQPAEVPPAVAGIPQASDGDPEGGQERDVTKIDARTDPALAVGVKVMKS